MQVKGREYFSGRVHSFGINKKRASWGMGARVQMLHRNAMKIIAVPLSSRCKTILTPASQWKWKKIWKILTILKVQTILTSAAFSERVKGENFGGFATCTNWFTNRIVWRTKINWSSQGIVRHPPHQTSTKLGNPPYWTSTRHPPRQTSTAPDIHHTRQSPHCV